MEGFRSTLETDRANNEKKAMPEIGCPRRSHRRRGLAFLRRRMSAMWHMSLAVGRRIGVEWDGVVGRRGVGRRGVGSVGNNRDERHGET